MFHRYFSPAGPMNPPVGRAPRLGCPSSKDYWTNRSNRLAASVIDPSSSSSSNLDCVGCRHHITVRPLEDSCPALFRTCAGRTEKLANFARLLIRDMKHTHVYRRGKRLTILDDPAHLSPKPSHAPIAMFPTGERKGMLVISRFMRARLENETDNNVTLAV